MTSIGLVRVIVGAAALPLLVTAAGAAVIWSWRDELPARVATHWGFDGAADGFSPVATVVTLVAGFGVIAAAAGLTLGLPSRGDPTLARAVAGTATGTAAFVAAVVVVTTANQRGLSDAANVRLSGGGMLAAVGVGLAAAAVAVVLQSRRRSRTDGTRPEGPPSSAPRIALAPDEIVVWTRSVATGSVPVVVVTVAVGLTALIAVLGRQWWILVITGLLTAFVVALWSIRVAVDRNGVMIRGRFGWPRSHTPLSEIHQADVVSVRPIRHFGGYGYRIAAFGPLRGAAGFILRGGDALVLERTGGTRMVVVVDDAATAAGLVNALLERDRPT